MGFSEVMSGIWEFFRNIFSGLWNMFNKDSREDEKADEEEVEKDIIKDTKAEEIEGKKEERDKEGILVELKKIKRKVSRRKNPLQIQVGKQIVPLDQALGVLIHHVKKLINTNESVVQEEMDLKPIENYWMVVRQGLINAELHKDVETVTVLFKELNIELEIEKKIHYSKIQLVQKQWKLIQEETQGRKAKRGASQKGNIINIQQGNAPHIQPEAEEKRRRLKFLKETGYLSKSREKVKV